MTVQHDLPTEVLAEEPETESPLKERLRQRRRELHSKEPIYLDLPGYDGELVVRYRPLGWEQVQKSISTDDEDNPVDLDGASNMLISACESVYVREGGALRELHERFDLGPLPVRYDSRLAEFLEVDAKTAREVVRGVINELAIPAHVSDLIQRSQDARQRAEDAFVGESGAPTP